MSGPKVVRIVTREEVIAICKQHLARLDAAIAAWIRSGQRMDVLSEENIARVRGRQADLRALLKNDDFLILQKQVPLEIEFLENDTQTRLADAVGRASSARAKVRRRASAAKSVLSALESANREIPGNMRRALSSLAAGTADEDHDGFLTQAFELLAQSPDESGISNEQSKLAQSLRDDNALEQSLTEWVANHERQEIPQLNRIDQLIAELAAIGGPSDVPEFEARYEALSAHEGPQQRLLGDSMVADLAAATVRARVRERLRQDLAACLEGFAEFAELAEAPLAQQVRSALHESDPQHLKPLLEEASLALEAANQSMAAAARRQALLEGLSSLGYEVREGMNTMLEAGRQLVLANPNTPDYGVEVIGAGNVEKLQMRVVTFGSQSEGRDQARDRDVEVQWCGDLDKLRERFSDLGTEIVIERATAAGEVPLKSVEGFSEEYIEDDAGKGQSRQRAHQGRTAPQVGSKIR